MLKIKLQPTGKRHQRFYRIVVAEGKSKLSGKVIDTLGTYNLIKVDPEDVGRVIGKEGKVIKSIRQIVRIAAIQKGTRAIVDLLEDDVTSRPEASEEISEEKVEELEKEAPEELAEKKEEALEEVAEAVGEKKEEASEE